MKHKLLILLAIFAITFSANAEIKNINSKDIFTFPTSITTSDSKQKTMILKSDKDARPIILKTAAVEKLFNSNIDVLRISDFPVSPIDNKSIVIKKKISVFDNDTKFYLGTKDGKKEMPRINMITYYGYIEGSENSRVYINYSEGRMFSIIENGQGEAFNITPVNNSKEPALLLTSPIDKNRNPNENPFRCMTEDYNGPKTEGIDNYKNKDVVLASSKLLEAGIICEGTNEYFAMHAKNYNNAAMYMGAVIAVSSQIYENDINIKFKINSVMIWEDKLTDPYVNDPLLTDKLQTMPSVWSSASDKRALVVLFANLYSQPSGTIVAGISMGGDPNTGSICSSARGYCVFGIHSDGNYPTLNYTWDVNCATHEMGHNFSSPHTHNCYFQPNLIDTCITKGKPIESDACLSGNYIPRLGTIMSYCHLTNSGFVELVFHPRNIKLIRTAAEKAICIKEPTIPTLKLLTPLGQSTYDAKKTIEIRWVYSLVSSIGIKYTIDNGQNWNVIKENVSVTDSIYSWTLPETGTTQAKVWIYDMSNKSVGDTSWNVFTINAPVLNIKKPVSGAKYGQKTPLVVQWDQMLVPKVNIDLSTDGGTTWQNKANAITAGQYTLDVTTVQSSNCKVKITSSDNSNIFTTSGIFAIGKEVAAMVYPQGGEIWCGSYSYYINWTADFVDFVVIEYTIDKGQTWTKVRAIPIDGYLGYYLWKLPKVTQTITDAQMRIYSSTDKETILGVSKTFTIDTCVKSDVNDQPVFSTSSPIQILDIIPNPATRNVKIKIFNQLGSNNSIELLMYDEKGSVVGNIGKFDLTDNGEMIYDINLPDLANGNYYLTVKSGKYQHTKNIQISK